MEGITMIFDDLFYPGNPGRRQEVANLRGEIIATFDKYKIAWNDNATLLNGIFANVTNPKFKGLTLLTLQKNISADSLGDCINEINDVISDTKTKLDKLVKDIGMDTLLPADWKEKGCTVDQIGAENVHKIGRIISGVVDSAAAAFVGYYAFTGVTVAVGLIATITGAATGLLAMCGGALGALVLGGAAFIITDIIASAITGAIERKELNDAIDTLKKIKDTVCKPLLTATEKLAGVTLAINDGNYKLDDKHLLFRKPDGSYVIIDTSLFNVRQLCSAQNKEILFLTA
jgi:hypothetical protein